MPSTESFAVYADLNCPYCYALNERFEKLGAELALEWRAIEHDPGVQSSVCTFEELDMLTSEIAAVRRRAPEVDIATPTFRPNTAHVNRVLVTATRADAARGRRLRTALYRALWRDGEDISDPAVIERHMDAVGLDSLPALDSVAPILDAWQSQWEDGEFSRRIPSTVSSGGRVLVGFAPLDDLLRFLEDGCFASAEADTCEQRAKPRIQVFGGDPRDLRAIVHAMKHHDLTLTRELPRAFAPSGGDALPDLVVLDTVLSVERCLAFCRSLKENPETRDVPVVLIGADRDEEELRAFEAGAADYLCRPFDRRVLGARISRHLSASRSARALEQMATVDSLTDIPNRRWFDHALEAEWLRARRDATDLSLLMVDVDCFKQYNDSYGHPKGDDCLRQVAAALTRVARRPADIVARYGGEEFALILPDTGEAGARCVAERCHGAIADLAIRHEHSVASARITISVGAISVDPRAFASPLELVSAADVNLIQAKRHGRDRTVASVLDEGRREHVSGRSTSASSCARPRRTWPRLGRSTRSGS